MPIYVNDGKSPLQSLNSTDHAAINHSAILGVPSSSKLTVLSKASGGGAATRSFAVTGGTLAADNDRITASALRQQIGATGTITVSYGGSTLATFASSTNEDYLFEIDIWRTGASAQRFAVKVFNAIAGTGTITSSHIGTLALDNSLSQTLSVSDGATATIVLLEVLKIAA